MSTSRLATAAWSISLYQAPPSSWNASVSTGDANIPQRGVYSIYSMESTRIRINLQSKGVFR